MTFRRPPLRVLRGRRRFHDIPEVVARKGTSEEQLRSEVIRRARKLDVDIGELDPLALVLKKVSSAVRIAREGEALYKDSTRQLGPTEADRRELQSMEARRKALERLQEMLALGKE